jgi:hypothetical protein
MRTVQLCVVAAFVTTIILLATPQFEAILNEPGTELLGLSLFKTTQTAVARPID